MEGYDDADNTTPAFITASAAATGNKVDTDASNANGDIHESDVPQIIPPFNPLQLLIVFTCCNLLTYFDRGSVGVCLDTIEDERVFDLSNFEGGLIGGSYMVGYMIASPIFAHIVRTANPMRVIAFGLFIWALANLATGLSLNYWILLLARAFTGVGEASFLCIAPPFIDKAAPPAKKSQWLALFYCAIPVGYALGFIVVGSTLKAETFGFDWTWRAIYIGEAALMMPFVIYCLFRGPIPFRFDGEDQPHLFRSIWSLLTNKLYMCIVLGYAAQTFTTGSFAYFGVQYLKQRLGMDVDVAGISFGGLTVFTGLLGTAGGGIILDKMRHGLPDGNASMAIAFKLMTILSIIAAPFCFLCFMLDGVALFYVFLGIGELAFFACLSPTNSAILWSVPFQLTPLACAMSVVVTHALGDAISPSILGSILDATSDDWHLTMFLNVAWSAWAIVFWAAGWRWALIAAKEEESTIVLPKSNPLPSTIRDPLLSSNGYGLSSDSFDYASAPVVHTGISVNGSR